jgi:hypothetical protein
MTTEPRKGQHLLTFRSGGWVLLLAGLLTIAIAIWALAGALARREAPLVGDGVNAGTYGFDLETCLVPRQRIVAAGMRKDALLALVDPPVIPAGEVARINEEERGKYLVAADRVIGVTLNDEARAYPLLIMNCHEIVNDTLSGTPIAVTYNPLCDSVVVFDRRVNGETLEFGVSGLLYNSNLLMYDRRPPAEGESLWSQLLARAVAGPAAAEGRRLRVLDAALACWADWLDDHPGTTVLDRDPRMIRRYRETSYKSYFQSPRLQFPVDPPPPTAGPGIKDRVVIVTADRARGVYALNDIARRVGADGTLETMIGDSAVRLRYRADPQTVAVSAAPGSQPITTTHAFWFAWHAMYPDDQPALRAP